MDNDLKALGLTWNETKVYKSLLKLGETAVGGIINDLKIHRQIAYNALDALEKREMVEKTTKNKVAHYKIANPEVLVEEIQRKEMIAKRLSLSIQEEMKKSRREHEINVYDGPERIQRYYLNKYASLPKESTIYVISDYVKKFEEVLGKGFISEQYNQARLKSKVVSRNIASESKRAEFGEFNRPLSAGRLREIRFLPDGMVPPVGLAIFPDAVSFASFEKDWFLMEVKNEGFREAYLKHFQLLWQVAKE